MSFNIGFPGMLTWFISMRMFSFLLSGVDAVGVAADATNTKQKLCLFRIVSI